MATFTRNNASGQPSNFEVLAGADGNVRDAVVVGSLVGGVATEASTATPLPVSDAVVEAAVGTPADVPWLGGLGPGTFVAIAKGIWTSLTGNLLVRSAGSTGTDYSANAAAIPGAFLLATAPVNPNRNAIFVQNQSSFNVQLVRDNGSGGQITSIFLAQATTGVPGSGGFWSSTTFKGRLRVFCASASMATVAMAED